MPLLFTCPHCRCETLVDDAFLGQAGACFTCGKAIVVPGIAPAEDELWRRREGENKAAQRRMWIGVAVIILLGLAAATVSYELFWSVGVPAIQEARATSLKSECAENLRRIGVAMEKYHVEHGKYPPTFSQDDEGKPLLSWRVHLLPYLGETQLYQRFKLNEPWDSVTNKNAASRMPKVYGCPSRPDAMKAGETSVMALVGPKTAFNNALAVSKRDITDNLAHTILLIEVDRGGVAWASPEDIDLSKLKLEVNGTKRDGIGSDHAGGTHVLMANGAVRFLSETVLPESLQALTTIDGGEPIAEDVFAD